MVRTKEFASALGMLIWKFPMKERVTFSTVLIGNGESCVVSIFGVLVFFFSVNYVPNLITILYTHILNFLHQLCSFHFFSFSLKLVIILVVKEYQEMI
jgi:hypothetical protein